MVSEQTPTFTGYQAARTGAALRDEGDHARLWLGGEDRIAFLQRISTNDVRLVPGQGTVTVLTSPTARIQAVLTALAMPAGLLLLAGPGQGPALFNTLRTQIFFNDKVNLEGRGGALAQFSLLGPQAAGLLAQIAGPVDDLPLFGWRTLAIAGVDVTVQRHEGLNNGGFILLIPSPAALAVKTALLRAGAVALDEEAYHVLRVEAGVPAPGCELTEQVNPLEAGLRRFCDDHKGCYTGQEIIARQITYDKVTTHLVGLLTEELAAPDAKIIADGKQVGWVSSAVHSVALDRPIALALVRRPHHDPGTPLVVQSGDQAIAAIVTTLPFDVEPEPRLSAAN
ncbi:MAG: glycine cleavage T C-terminal barrel domain-containing protein [Anaerolineae bacterium]